jgi:hypothetical protein
MPQLGGTEDIQPISGKLGFGDNVLQGDNPRPMVASSLRLLLSSAEELV